MSLDYLLKSASERVQIMLINELTKIALEVVKKTSANEELKDAINAQVETFSASFKRSFLESVSEIVNTAFTSDVTSRAGLIKWSKHAPLANEDRDLTFEGQPLSALWMQASTVTSNLFAVEKVDKFIDDSKLKGPYGTVTSLDVSHSLLRFSDLKTWGVDRHFIPTFQSIRELVSKADLESALSSLSARASERDLMSIPEPYASLVKKIYDMPFAHLLYKFAIGPSAQYHHSLYVGNRVNVEVQNIILNGHVTSLVTPSTLLNFMLRARSNGMGGIYEATYDTAYPVEVIRKRALWTIGQTSYNVITNNCESLCSWVLTNNNSNQTCSYLRATLGLSPKRRPTSVRNSVKRSRSKNSVSRRVQSLSHEISSEFKR